MNWFKHKSTDRDRFNEKLIRHQFGSHGYGIHCVLLEIIAENVKADNIEEWGCVEKRHTTETLSIECSCSIDQLEEFFSYVDEKSIYQRRNGQLFYPEMLNRLDDYAERIKAEKKKRKSRYKVGISSDKVGKSRTIEREPEGEKEPEEKQEGESKGSPQKTISYLLNVPDRDLAQYEEKFPPLTSMEIKSEAAGAHDWLKSKGTIKKDYAAFLRNWLRKAVEYRQNKSQSRYQVSEIAL